MKNSKNILVVGGGLSGISVCFHLIRKGINTTLIHNNINHSSSVAAAMINPLVFRRMTKSWRVDELIPYLIQFYSEIEHLTNTHFFRQVAIRRMFSSEQERNFWIEKELQSDYINYMEVINESDDQYDKAKNEYGTGRLKNAYSVDSKIFIPEMLNWIEKNGKLQLEEFDYSQFLDRKYKGIEYDDIVFCEGYMNYKNPWFKHLPVQQTKGETLTVKANSLPENVSLNRKCFMLPMGNNIFKVGSTYEWNSIDTSITTYGREMILKNLAFLTDEKVEVINQEAGIRPTSPDRRPILGTHSDKKHYHIFNALGAKGYLIAPLLSKEFVEYLLEGKALHEEVRLNRFL